MLMRLALPVGLHGSTVYRPSWYSTGKQATGEEAAPASSFKICFPSIQSIDDVKPPGVIVGHHLTTITNERQSRSVSVTLKHTLSN